MSQLPQDVQETSSYQQIQDQGLTSTSSTVPSSTFLDKQQQIQQIQKIEVTSPILPNNSIEQQQLQQNQMRNIVTLSLICEDRQSSKKCCFPNLQLEQSIPSNKVNVFNLLNSSLSVKSFLKGHLIFVDEDGIDIALGLFPLEMDKKFEVALTQAGEKYSIKLIHQAVSSSSRNKSSSNCSDTTSKVQQQGGSQGKQLRKRQGGDEQNASKSNVFLGPDDTKQEYSSLRKIDSVGSSSNHSHSSEIQTHSSYEENNQFDEEDEDCIDLINLGKMRRNRTSHTASSDLVQVEKFHLTSSQNDMEEDKCIETEENMDDEEEQEDDGEDDAEGGLSGSQSSKNSSVLKKGIKKDKTQMYKSISKLQKNIIKSIKGEHQADNNQQPQQQGNQAESAPKKRRRQTLNKRSHERTIREGIILVTQWRNDHEYYKSKNQVKDLQEVAKDMGISKKTLDYYYLELRTAEFFNFDFDSHLNQRMGFLRQFIEDETKKFQDLNKQAKIPRQLNFKYRLPEHRGNNNSNSNNNAASNTINNNMGMQILQNQQNNIYIQKDNFNTSQSIMIPHPNHQHHHQNHQHHHHHYQNQHQPQHYIQPQSQVIPPIISQQQKLNQILHQIDANSTSSLSVFNQTTHTEGSLNQSDHNFLSSSATIHHYPSHQSHQMQSSQVQQIFQNQNSQAQNSCDQKINSEQLRIDPSSNQIVDYSIQSGSNNRNLISQERTTYTNYNIPNHAIQPEDFKPIFQYTEQQNTSGDQNTNPMPSSQQNHIGRFMSGQGQLITLPSTQSISDSNHNLHYQRSHQNQHRIQSQQQMVKQNPEIIHPYEQKQQNEGYKQFLDKQKQLKQQEMLEESPLQHIFE